MADTRPTRLWGRDGAMYVIAPEDLETYLVPDEQAAQIEAHLASTGRGESEVGGFDFGNPHDAVSTNQLAVSDLAYEPGGDGQVVVDGRGRQFPGLVY